MTRATGKGHLSEGSVRIATIAAIPLVLEQLGYDPTAVMRECDFDISLFDAPDNVITFYDRSRLIQRCVETTGCSHFGLLIGQHIGPSALGLIGFLIQHSPDVATALQSLVHFFHLHVHGAVVHLERDNGSVFLGYSIHEPNVVAHQQIEDGAVAGMFNILRRLCGPSWKPDAVHFSHENLADSRIYKQFFNVPLKFDVERSGILFSAHWLQTPVAGADPDLYRYLHKQIDELNHQYGNDFAEQVRRVLHSALYAQRATADHIAAVFSIHPRTLNRRLRSCGTSFQELADQSRFEIAQQLLENSSMQLNQIAATLNYSDASAFSRAFRRWSGMTPALWREQSQQADA
jgi:AraC-like DNA-binding protein